MPTHAIVIGGSIAGLLAARVLADAFDRVTILDRDHFPAHPASRGGAPQAHHTHVLLARGQQVYEQLFPGFADELAAEGAPRLEWGYDTLLYTLGVWLPRIHTGLSTSMCSRDLLEFTVRKRVAAHPNVETLEGRDVTGLLATESGSRVTGVRTRLRPHARESSTTASGEGDSGPSDTAGSMGADLVVDASGRSSRTPEWLKELGFPPPSETTVNSFLGYASRLYSPPPGYHSDVKSFILRGRGKLIQRGGVLYPIEGDRWLVTLAGAARDYPPLEDAEFLKFAETLGDPPLLYQAIKDAQPISPIVGYQRTDNRWRHYEHLERFPDNFVVLGDAVCAFNPVYGQGLTVAALDALTLQRCVKEQRGRTGNLHNLEGMALPFQRELVKNLETPWLMATNEDFRYPETQGAKPGRLTHLLHRYFDRVVVSSSKNVDLFRAFVLVSNLLKPPSMLFSPGIAAQALLGLKRA